MTYEDLIEGRKTTTAVLRSFEIIGIQKNSPVIRNNFPFVLWKKIVNTDTDKLKGA